MQRNELIAYLDDYLQIREIADYGPQGLQVEAETDTVERIALAVDTCPATIEAAANWGANMLLVHHGIFWGGAQPIAGPFGQRVRLLLKHNIHLYGAHLALDAHPEVGNNVVLAQMFGVAVESWWCAPKGTPIGVLGRLAEPMALAELTAAVNGRLATVARVLAHGPERIQTVAIVSGFGADKVETVQQLGADLFLTGETSHAHFWAASDVGMNVIYAGHYATETVGVKALGAHLAEKFDVAVRFFDFPTGM
jgi:dinuclear metal center YbgI/SA1388 family protein